MKYVNVVLDDSVLDIDSWLPESLTKDIADYVSKGTVGSELGCLLQEQKEGDLKNG